MRHATIAAASQIYRLADVASIEPVVATDDTLRSFDDQLRKLRRSLGEIGSDEYWASGLSWLKRCRFNLLATPLPAGHPALGVLTAVAVARDHFQDCDRIYPGRQAAIDAVCDALMEVFVVNSDALSQAITAAVAAREDAGRVVVVLPSYGLEAPVSHHLRSLPALESVDVLRPAQLELKRPYDLLFAVGRGSWYEQRRSGWIFTAPRAEATFVVCYEWMLEHELPSAQAFSRSRSGTRALTHPFRYPEAGDVDVAGLDEPEMEIDWELLARELPRDPGSEDPGELVEARLLLLADGRGAFVGASEDSRVQVLRPDEPSGKRTDWYPTTDVIPGSYVLLRSEGGGDLIVTVADNLLGPASARLRAMQSQWKSGLRARIDTDGLDRVVTALRARGASRASRGNVLNWVWPRSLRTADEADFFAVMRLVGLEAEERTYWNAMGKLNDAHRRAGHQIRDQLEKEAERANLLELETTGWLDFKLPDGGGALTAFRVEDISPQTYAVPYPRLGEPFRSRF